MAEIKWFGHACVHIRAREASIMMDPVSRSLGYRYNKQRANIVTLSHDHPGHTAIEMISTDFKLINGPGEYEISDVFITGIRTYHDTERGALHGRNTIYVVEVEGVTICHLGDLAHELTDEQQEAIPSIDVLLAPVGGGNALDAVKAAAVIGQIEPGVVVPIQYRTEYGDQHLDELERFLHEMAAGEVAPEEKLTVRRFSADSTSTSVVVLACSATGR
jgi:L-ascorbate metabolism protein UlaG (beta-lactamase superfamily)